MTYTVLHFLTSNSLLRSLEEDKFEIQMLAYDYNNIFYRYLIRFGDESCDILNVCNQDIFPEPNSFGNEIVAFKGDDIPCQFCTKVILT